MPIPLTAAEVLNREFLEMRARLLQLAASLDRLDRAKGNVADDARMTKLRQALAILDGEGPGRAEKLQMLFSRMYEQEWRDTLGVTAARASTTLDRVSGR